MDVITKESEQTEADLRKKKKKLNKLPGQIQFHVSDK